MSCPAHDACAGVEAFYEIDEGLEGERGYIITLGYILTMALAVPFSIIEIVDWCQGIMYTISLVCVLEMIVDFSFIADDGSFRAANGMMGATAVAPWGYNLGLARSSAQSQLPAHSSAVSTAHVLRFHVRNRFSRLARQPPREPSPSRGIVYVNQRTALSPASGRRSAAAAQPTRTRIERRSLPPVQPSVLCGVG